MISMATDLPARAEVPVGRVRVLIEDMRMRLSRPPLLLLLLLTFSVGCNEPPLYGTRAREFLRAQGIPSETIEKLTTTQPLDPEEAERLSHFENV